MERNVNIHEIMDLPVIWNGEKNPNIISVTSAEFGNGQLFTNITSDWVGLRNRLDGSIIKIQTKGFPYCMLWQNTKGTPGEEFVCEQNVWVE